MYKERCQDRIAAIRDALDYNLARMVDYVVSDRDGKIPICLACSHPGRAILREEARSGCQLRCAAGPTQRRGVKEAQRGSEEQRCCQHGDPERGGHGGVVLVAGNW